MDTDLREPWHRLDDESDSSFVRYLIYRNLGPGRSLQLGAEVYYSSQHDDPERTKTSQAPGGHWKEESARHNWVKRARAWDVAMLSVHGMDAVNAFVVCLERAAEKAAQALDRLEGPQDWAEVLSSLQVLSGVIPEEVIRELATNGDLRQAVQVHGDDRSIYTRHGKN